MMPQHLSGEEFRYIDHADNLTLNSPTAKITTLVAHFKDLFVSFVKVEGNWIYFSNETIKKIGNFKEVISILLEESLFPFILIYQVGSLEEEKEEDVLDILQDYYEHASLKKGKIHNIMEMNYTGSEDSFTRVRITDIYQKRSLLGSKLSQDKRPKKALFSGAKCCF